MDTQYDTYFETINGLEAIEQQVITDNKVKRGCYLSLEFVKSVINCLKNIKKSE